MERGEGKREEGCGRTRRVSTPCGEASRPRAPAPAPLLRPLSPFRLPAAWEAAHGKPRAGSRVSCCSAGRLSCERRAHATHARRRQALRHGGGGGGMGEGHGAA